MNNNYTNLFTNSIRQSNSVNPFRDTWIKYIDHDYLDIKNTQSELTLKIRLAKRIFDIFFSLIVMIFGLPIFALLYLITKFSSPGPAFYKQERMGKNARKFYIYKFRSMHIDAERLGPQLSSVVDSRITKWGRVIRKTRLDELPQFWNVLKGDMAIVGPRPERHYYAEQIIQRNPEYFRLQRIKPGITSMGQVQFGYAESVDEMCERIQIDLSYLHSVSFKTDVNVIVKTVGIMIACKGK